MDRDDARADGAAVASWIEDYRRILREEGAGPGPTDLPEEVETAGPPPPLEDVIACLRLAARVWPTPGGPEPRPTATFLDDAPADLSWRPPSPRLTLAGFEVFEELGRGGMGLVYRARQLSLGRDVALKILPPELAADPARLRRFRNEATIAAGLHGSQVLPVHDVRESDQGLPVLVMPFIDGPDLFALVANRGAARAAEAKRGAPSEEADRAYLAAVLPLLDQVVGAVATIHEAGILHRDIKPSNVLVDRRACVWLTDFGLARLGTASSLTVAGVRLGTPGFMSPEQWEGREDVDYRADVFSLGATLYQALTLALPYGTARVDARAPRPRRPGAVQPLLGRALDGVIIRALEPEREDRYRDATELREDWRRARTGQGPRLWDPRPLRRAGRWGRRHRWALVNGLLAACLLGAAGAGALRGGGNGAAPPAPAGPPAPHWVWLRTEPPGARAILVPLAPGDGKPQTARAIRPARGAVTPLRLDVPPGDYLVEVGIPGLGFQEVYRRVAGRGDATIPERHGRVTWNRGGDAELARINIPTGDVARGMVRFEGSPAFRLGSTRLRCLSPRDCDVPPFLLDAAEVTVGDYRRVTGTLPLAIRLNRPEKLPDDLEALTFVSFDEALEYAERVGKRLPFEEEYEFAATMGGRSEFPWGDSSAPILGQPWVLGPVGGASFDRTPTEPPVLGLYSNATEWTMSWMTPNMDSPLSGLLPFAGARVVRGGPPTVSLGQPARTDAVAVGPRQRHGHAKVSARPGVGFRCARSVRPRYLELGPHG